MNGTSNCETPYCRNRIKNGRVCATCRSRRWRKNNPFKYHYNNLRNRARQRGKPFNLALEQFILIWICEPEKWKEKLAKDECKWQLDRINEGKGYEYGNLQILTKRKNIMKYIHHKNGFTIDVKWEPVPKPIDEDIPF